MNVSTTVRVGVSVDSPPIPFRVPVVEPSAYTSCIEPGEREREIEKERDDEREY